MDNLEEMNKFLGKYSLPKLSGINRQHEQTIAQFVKNPPAMQETLVQSLGWEDPLEKGRATHSSILAWRIPWTVYPWSHKESDVTE